MRQKWLGHPVYPRQVNLQWPFGETTGGRPPPIEWFEVLGIAAVRL
jgi:hypothetical protein